MVLVSFLGETGVDSGNAFLINTHTQPFLCGRKLASRRKVLGVFHNCMDLWVCGLWARVDKSGGEAVERRSRTGIVVDSRRSFDRTPRWRGAKDRVPAVTRRRRGAEPMFEYDKSSKWLIQHQGDSILRMAGVRD